MLERIFPIINDLALKIMDGERARVLLDATGDVLELGMGTGLNIVHYRGITSLTGIEPAPAMRKLAEKRGAELQIPFQVHEGFAEKLPFDDARFDTVAATFVMCTVRNVSQTLHEVNRVLRPGGKLILLEHVRSESQRLAKWQDRVTPVWKIVFSGCHPNRDLGRLPESAGFTPVRVEAFDSPQPAIVKPHIRGLWTKSTR